MRTLVMIPALCCDEGLYGEVAERLSDLVSPRIIIPYEATFARCAATLEAVKFAVTDESSLQ